MQILSLLTRPIVEELRVTKCEACQERTTGQVRGLLELCQQLFTSLAREWFNTPPYLLADRFDEAEAQDD